MNLRELEREMGDKRFEWRKLLAARLVNKRREEKRLGRFLTEEERDEINFNTKVPTTVEFLLGIYK